MSDKKSIEIIRSKRRSLSLEVTDTARIIVRAPFRLSERKINHFIDKNSDWLEKKYNQSISRLVLRENMTFETGEVLQYLGTSFPIKKTNGKSISFLDEFHIPNKSADELMILLKVWYRNQAKELFAERINLHARDMNLSPRQIKITNAQKRWGSCSSLGNINMSWRLILAPISVIDYVAVHELSHMKHMNHSKKFWLTVENQLPKYKESQKWLADYGHYLSL